MTLIILYNPEDWYTGLESEKSRKKDKKRFETRRYGWSEKIIEFCQTWHPAHIRQKRGRHSQRKGWGRHQISSQGDPRLTAVALLVVNVLHSELFLGVVSDFNQSIKVILLNWRCLLLSVILVLLAQEAKSRVRYTFVVSWTVSFKKICSTLHSCYLWIWPYLETRSLKIWSI